MVKLDKKDRRILTELDMNARVPLTKLAKKVGLSRQVVDYRIKKLQKEKVIFGALTIFDSVRVGYNWYRLTLRLLNITKEKKNEIINYLKSHEYIGWLGEIGGNWDLAMNFICSDTFEFNKIFEEIIKKYGEFINNYEILVYINLHDYQRTYILDTKKARKEFFHEMQLNKKLKLDDIDKKIIKEISLNAFMTNVEIGQKLKISRNTVKNRIEHMKKNKIILGFRLMINPSVFGYSSHMLFLGVNKINTQREKEFHAYLKSIPNISFVVKHIGKWRIGMEIETRNEKEFQDIFVEIRGKFSDIISDFETFPIFKDHAINYFANGNLK